MATDRFHLTEVRCIGEPELLALGRAYDAADYAALWGCDSFYDKPPRELGDGAMFYNFRDERWEPEFLIKFIPAIGRTIAEVERREADAEQQEDLVALAALRTYCQVVLQELRQQLPGGLAVGDRVQFSKQFLQNTGQYTGEMPRARGVIEEIEPLGKSGTYLATIDWDQVPDEVPDTVNLVNLSLVGSRED